MGTLLFALLAATEVALVIYCLRTKSEQPRTMAYTRLGALTAFALLFPLGITTWGIRYYPLAALLLLSALVAVSKTARAQQQPKPARLVRRGAGMIALFLIATAPVMLFPLHPPLAPTGTYQVATATRILVDPSRIETYTNTGQPRKLTVGFWYPQTPKEGKFPLIVFSHGGIADMNSNESLYLELASHGYVVASINHTYQALTAKDEAGRTIWIDRGYLHDILTEDAKANRQQSHEYYQTWMQVRMGDINRVIDQILAEARDAKADGPYRLVDTTAIGVMGHSLGGAAALGIGRVRPDLRAVIALESPFMYDITGVENGEFVYTEATYPVPMLNVYTDSTWTKLDTLPQYKQNYAFLSAPNVHITGAGHFSLTDLALASPGLTHFLNRVPTTRDDEDTLRTVNQVCRSFLDAHLKRRHSGEPLHRI